jgi:quinol monooxygenase YgiN
MDSNFFRARAVSAVWTRIAPGTAAVLLLAALSSIAETGTRLQEVSSGANVVTEKPNVASDELVIFARFHAIEGKEAAVAAELRDAVARVRVEPGCISIHAYRSIRDARLFWLHARWTDEVAFDKHAALPATNQFVERAERLIDHPFDVTRTRVLE